MYIRKLITTAAIIGVFISQTSSAFAGSISNTNEINTNISFADYVSTLYPENVKIENENEIIDIFKNFETKTNCSTAPTKTFSIANKDLTGTIAYYGKKTDVNYFCDLMEYEYGFVPLEIKRCFRSNGEGFITSDVSDISSYKAEYIRIAEKAKKIAETMKGADDITTLHNIYNYAAAKRSTGKGDGQKGCTGFYDGLPVVCSGYASVIAQLCRFNGIKCIVETGYYNGAYHAWNKAQIGDKIYYLDAAMMNGIMEQLPSSYAYSK